MKMQSLSSDYLDNPNIVCVSMSSNDFQNAAYSAFDFDFSFEWKSLILEMCASENPLQQGLKWTEGKYARMRTQMLKISSGELSCDSRIFVVPSWTDFLFDLQERIPVIGLLQIPLIYKSRMFLLPRRVQCDILTLINENRSRMDVDCLAKFSSFLEENFECLNDWGKKIVQSCFSEDVLFTNLPSTKARKMHSQNFQLLYKDKVFLTGNKESDNKLYHVFLEQEPNSVKRNSIDLHHVIPLSCQQDIKDTNFSIIDSVVDKPEENQPFKKQKLYNEGLSDIGKKIPLDQLMNISINDIAKTVSSNATKDCSGSFTTWLHSTGKVAQVMLLKNLIQNGDKYESACTELTEVTSYSVQHIDDLSEIICLNSLNETALVFFLKCCSSSQVNVSSTILNKLLSNSLLPFLLRMKEPISRTLFFYLMEVTKKSKECVITSVIVPMMAEKELNNNQVETVLKFLNSGYLLPENLVELLNSYLVILMQGKAVALETAMKFLENLLERKLNVIPNSVIKLLSVLEMNSKEIKSSKRFIKVIILLTKFYSVVIAPHKNRLIQLVEQNTSFLRRKAMANLKNI